tara:strand:+ start:527 stop:2125 length:1599 start_codon:yes stop_codon:yes gene_type:complete
MNNELSKIIDLVNTQNYSKAETLLNRLIEENPNSFEFNKILGVCLLSQRKYNRALKAFNICYEIKKDDFDVNTNLSFLFIKVQDFKHAIKFSDEAIAKDPSRPHAYHNLAQCYLFLGNYDKAKENVLLSIKYRGGMGSDEVLAYPDLINLYADILLAKNEIDEFKEFAQKILDSGSYQSDLFRKLMKNGRDDIKPFHIETLEKVINDSNKIESLLRRNATISAAYFCLAEYYSKIDNAKSEDFYLNANKKIAEMQRQSLFQRQKKYSNVIKLFQDLNCEDIQSNIDPLKGDGLIFVMGMPRSGTSLTESILSTADNIVAGGERVFFTVQIENMLDKINLDNFNSDFFNSLGDSYLEIISIQREGKKFFIDKLPENYRFYKFIKLALPGAKFINVSRDSWDNAISLFKENYSFEIYYSSSFFGIALEYANYENNIKFWKSLDGNDCMLDLKYEDLVSNTDEMVKKIWQYCNLSGNYSSEKRKSHFVNTASKQQVTKDIFQTSIEKKDFQDFKGQFNDDLESQRKYWSKIMESL